MKDILLAAIIAAAWTAYTHWPAKVVTATDISLEPVVVRDRLEDVTVGDDLFPAPEQRGKESIIIHKRGATCVYSGTADESGCVEVP